MNINITNKLIGVLSKELDTEIQLEQFDRNTSKQLQLIAQGEKENRQYDLDGINYIGTQQVRLCAKIQQNEQHIEWVFETFNKLKDVENKLVGLMNDGSLKNIDVLDIKIYDVVKDDILQKSYGLAYQQTITVEYYFSNEV